ncbi:MAG: response regulator [Polyangiaceae bacterium]
MNIGQRNSRTILVIDGDPVAVQLTRATLEKAGYRVVARDRASGAINAVLQERPDLILLEVNMPSMTGDSLADVLSRTRAARGTVVVLYSSLPANVLSLKALAAGAHGFIQKSALQMDLVRQVRGFLEQSDSLSALRAAAPVSSEEMAASSARIRVAPRVEERSSRAPLSSGSAPAAPLSSPVPDTNVALSASSPPPLRDSGTLRITLPTALFLDDDLAVLTGYRRALSSEEVIGEYLTSADQALRRISMAEPPDVVVTDLVMPGMNGIELYRHALEFDPTWRHRFVFITGARTVSYVADFLRRVGGRALDKPVDIRRLRDAIRYAATGARIFRKQSADG